MWPSAQVQATRGLRRTRSRARDCEVSPSHSGRFASPSRGARSQEMATAGWKQLERTGRTAFAFEAVCYSYFVALSNDSVWAWNVTTHFCGRQNQPSADQVWNHFST